MKEMIKIDMDNFIEKNIIYCGFVRCPRDKNEQINLGFAIGLYDLRLDKLEYIQSNAKINDDEYGFFSVLNAIVYAITYKIKNVIILTDNKEAFNNSTLKKFANKHKIDINLIPKEINKIRNTSDSIDLSIESNEKFNNLELIYNLVKPFLLNPIMFEEINANIGDQYIGEKAFNTKKVIIRKKYENDDDD